MSTFSDKLKQLRKDNNLSVAEVVEKLNDRGVEIGAKALYHWEAGRRMPDADEFVYLCEIYNVESFSIFDDKKKAPAPEGTEAVSMEQSNRLYDALVAAGLIVDDDLAAQDFQFLGHICDLITDWFSSKHPE